ncbi:MAG TPA: hypothetical protein VLR89_07190, partial [Anaerolineaceae bacterium]|nr:hypothetical protein [Anaerolineaceae bacterium]
MFENLKLLLQKTVVKPIKLSFELDMDSGGFHHVSVFKVSENGSEKIINPQSLLAPGYHEEYQRGKSHEFLLLDPQDRHTLLSLQSLNPETQPDGTMVFEVIPPILKYLRRKKIVESSAA